MKIEAIATREVITVRTTDSMLTASKLLKERVIRHLPVLDEKGRLVGVITDRDIKRASASEATSLDIHELLYLLDRLEVTKVMTRNPVTLPLGATVQEAAQLMIRHKIGCILIMDGGKLAGIVTDVDMLKLLARGEG